MQTRDQDGTTPGVLTAGDEDYDRAMVKDPD
jgi:hypothetical protein